GHKHNLSCEIDVHGEDPPGLAETVFHVRADGAQPPRQVRGKRMNVFVDTMGSLAGRTDAGCPILNALFAFRVGSPNLNAPTFASSPPRPGRDLPILLGH